MLTKCAVCGSYDVEFYETIGNRYYCDGCFRESGFYETCLDTTFVNGTDLWCAHGYWLESPDYDS